MVKAVYTLLVLADDLTGALDTGVQFAKGGIPTRVCLRWEKDGAGDSGPSPAEGALVINSGTRHCAPGEARRVIKEILARHPAIPYVYKKTDSTLRGNIGAELEALVQARNLRVLPFVPAYPNLGRTTRQGRQYLDGLPIDETAAARDALNPVRSSFIPAIIAEESALPVRLIPAGAGGPAGGPEIRVYDAESNADLRNTAHALWEQGLLETAAGCAGFAEPLVERIPFAGGGGAASGGPEGRPLKPPPAARPVLIISGSRHPVSLAQVRTAVEAGVPALGVEGSKLLRPPWFEGEEAASVISRCGELLAAGGRCILGTRMSLGQEEAGGGETAGAYGIAGLLGKLLKPILRLTGPIHLAVFGGDTLSGIMETLDCRFLEPIGEIRPGVVLAGAERPGGGLFIAAKSGAFGEPGIITEIVDFFHRGA
jgi:uncharacterized protein YgbK (DUF1537 family)